MPDVADGESDIVLNTLSIPTELDKVLGEIADATGLAKSEIMLACLAAGLAQLETTILNARTSAMGEAISKESGDDV